MAFCKTCKQQKSIFDMVEVGDTDTDICVECSRLAAGRIFAGPLSNGVQKPDPSMVAERAARFAEMQRAARFTEMQRAAWFTEMRRAAWFTEMERDEQRRQDAEASDLTADRALKLLVWDFTAALVKDAMREAALGELRPLHDPALCTGCVSLLSLAGKSWSKSKNLGFTWRLALCRCADTAPCAVCAAPADITVQVRLEFDPPAAPLASREESERSAAPPVQESAPPTETHFFCARCESYLRLKGSVTFKATGRVMTLAGVSSLPSATDLCMACSRPAISALLVRFGDDIAL